MIVTCPDSSTRYELIRPLPRRWREGAICISGARAPDALGDPEEEREPTLGRVGDRAGGALDHRIELEQAVEGGVKVRDGPRSRLGGEVAHPELADDLHRSPDRRQGLAGGDPIGDLE